MCKPLKVTIEIAGGVLCAVYAAEPIEIVLIDWDDIENGDAFGPGPIEPSIECEEKTQKRINEAMKEAQKNAEMSE